MAIVECRIVGVTFLNKDGTDRQTLLASVQAGSPVVLIAEPENPVDQNAVKVVRPHTGDQLGYLPRDVATSMARGKVAFPRDGVVTHVYGSPEKDTRGARIEFQTA